MRHLTIVASYHPANLFLPAKCATTLLPTANRRATPFPILTSPPALWAARSTGRSGATTAVILPFHGTTVLLAHCGHSANNPDAHATCQG